VVAYTEGGRKGAIWLPKGRGGWGWSRVVGELRKLLSFLGLKARLPGGGISSSEGTPKGGDLSKALDFQGATDGSPTGVKKGRDQVLRRSRRWCTRELPPLSWVAGLWC
jgi:hypothetical protein